jgi:hypothetical protein
MNYTFNQTKYLTNILSNETYGNWTINITNETFNTDEFGPTPIIRGRYTTISPTESSYNGNLQGVITILMIILIIIIVCLNICYCCALNEKRTYIERRFSEND